MCTIAVLDRVEPRYPLAVIANRDELRDRPASKPRVLFESPRAIGGIDLVSGGTWMGANEHDLFVGLTNQRSLEPPDRSKRSRGEIVARALRERDPDAVAALLATIDARQHNGFNLIFGALGDVRVAYGRPEERAIEIARCGPGITVLANDRLGSPDFPKTARAEARVADALAHLEDGIWLRALADHELPPIERVGPPPEGSRFTRELLRELQALCIHLPFYGTVSATAILFDRRGRLARYIFAEGPPCVGEFQDVTALLGNR